MLLCLVGKTRLRLRMRSDVSMRTCTLEGLLHTRPYALEIYEYMIFRIFIVYSTVAFTLAVFVAAPPDLFCFRDLCHSQCISLSFSV